MKPIRFIGESITVCFDEQPRVTNKPGRSASFTPRDHAHRVVETLQEPHDYRRRGRMAYNQLPTTYPSA